MSLIDDHLNSIIPTTRQSGVVYVTDIVKPCTRQAVLDIINPPKHPVETLRIFESGKIIEDWVVSIMKQSQDYHVIGIQIPVRWPTDWGSIHGRIDVLAQKKRGSLILFEVKSIKNFDYLKATKPSHELQTNFYLNVLNMDFGECYYVSKEAMLNGHERINEYMPIDRRFVVQRNPQTFASMIKRGGEIEEGVSTKTLPNGTLNAMCEECHYKMTCDVEDIKRLYQNTP